MSDNNHSTHNIYISFKYHQVDANIETDTDRHNLTLDSVIDSKHP